MDKISFGGNITYEIEKYLNKYKSLFLEILNNDELEFTNYVSEEINSYIIPVEKNNISNKFRNSYFIYWDGDGIRNYSDRYIRIEKISGLNIGLILNDDTYMELFLPEEKYKKNEKLFDEYIIEWTTNKASIVNSKFVTKHKLLQKYFSWTGGESGLPNHLIIEFSLKGKQNIYELIKEFTNAGLNLNKINDFVKKLEKTNEK